MFQKIINWIKTHKLDTFLILVVAYFALGGFFKRYTGVSTLRYENYGVAPSYGVDSVSGGVFSGIGSVSKTTPYTIPQVAVSEDRKVITNSSFSLLVKNVNQSIDSVNQMTKQLNGYMIQTQINHTEGADTATIEVRVPVDKLDQFSKYLRSLAVKVVYENITGYDITDQYTDYVRRIASLESARSKLESIMNIATRADDILDIQNKIFQIQDQIDALKGKLDYMDKASTTAKVTIVISTDEMGLPYTPTKSWKPSVIFKQAVRSLISSLQTIATWIIWALVFSPFVILALIIWWVIKRRKSKTLQANKV